MFFGGDSDECPEPAPKPVYPSTLLTLSEAEAIGAKPRGTATDEDVIALVKSVQILCSQNYEATVQAQSAKSQEVRLADSNVYLQQQIRDLKQQVVILLKVVPKEVLLEQLVRRESEEDS